MVEFETIFQRKKVVITGDTGFKGSWLAIWLHHLGADVRGIALPPRTPRDNYVVCGLEDRYPHTDLDIRDYDSVLRVFSRFRPEIVFHLAAQALVLDSYQEPRHTFDTNLMGTVNILEAIRQTDSIKAAVMVTTDKCYENRDWIYGYRESDRLGGSDPYSASKAACETAITAYTRSYFNGSGSATIASVRAGNVIGGGDWAANRLVPDIIKALEKGDPVPIRRPNAVRPWQHVLEPLSGYLTLGTLLYAKGPEFSGPWNFGPYSQNHVTVKDLAQKLLNQWGSGALAIQNEPSPPPEATRLHLDITKAITQLKWRPRLTLDETVAFTIEEYQIDGMGKETTLQQRLDHISRYMGK
jgi:CDP-glucose 4,6-dehydratase